MKKGLLGDLVPTRSSKQSDLDKLSKITTKGATTIKSGKNNSIIDKINLINAEVYKHLGKYKESIEIILTKEQLEIYIDKCLSNGIVAIDTETTSLDPITCELVGVCLYTPTFSSVYVPVNHQSYITACRLEDQISVDDLKTQLERLKGIKHIYHNAKYDLRVLHWYLGIDFEPYWDTMIAAKLLNENESMALKYQYAKYIEKTDKEYDFDSLFKGVDFRQVPIETAAMYAATDAFITYKLYQFQNQFIGTEKYKGLSEVFFTIEMPLIPVIADMENTGITIDTKFANSLSEKYHKQMDDIEAEVYAEMKTYDEAISKYKVKNPGHKLSEPISISSPTQLAILLYDIIGVKPVDKEKPRGTGEEILLKIDLPICKKILQYREVAKLLTTYIDKLPAVANPKTGKIHASFNQYGAATGRFSSSDPNLQNIPSHNKEIRKMFVSQDGYVLVGSDFSQQEPRTLAHFSDDENMKQAYLQGKDLYATIASRIYGVPYEQCLEFYLDENGKKTDKTNPEGKKRRTSCKSVLLGIMYGRGSASVAEQMGISTKAAQEIIDNFYKGFPKVKAWMDKTVEDAKKYGYVETLWGRKRRLPDMLLPEFEFELTSSRPNNFNPLFDDFEMEDDSSEKIAYYKKAMYNAFGFRQKQDVKMRALNDGIKIKDNGGFISEATRQCVNSRIQGSAADMTKLAMNHIWRDERLKKLGFKILLTVHDEIIGECPEENAKEVAKLLSEDMINSAKEKVSVPMKCDAEITRAWYGEPIA